MALAFFTAPSLPSLTSFGFGKAANASSEPSSESNPRPESMSANAVIKCSDCGGDVILAQLGEHVCNPSQPTSIPQKEEVEVIIDELATKPQELGRPPEPTKPRELSQLLGPSKTLEPIKPLETRQPSEPTILSEPSQPLDSSREIPEPSKFPEPIKRSEPPKPRVDDRQTQDPPGEPQESPPPETQPIAAFDPANSLKQKLTYFMRSESSSFDNSSSVSSSSSAQMSEKSRNNSSSEYSLSNSEISSSSVSSNARMPFFEKYAQLMPQPSNNQTTAPIGNKSRPKFSTKSTPRKVLTPITSPESSPKKSSYDAVSSSQSKPTLSSLAKLSITPQPKLPTSQSMPFSSLIQPGLASQRREAASRRHGVENNLSTSVSAASGLDKLASRGHADSPRHNETHTSGASRPRDRLNERSASGLEDLMGDLMAEMEKKAELTSELYKARAPVRPTAWTPESPVPASRTRPNVHGASSNGRRPPNAYPDDPSKLHTRQISLSDSVNESGSPSSPDIRPSDSISQFGHTRSPSPKLIPPFKLPPRNSGTQCHRCGSAPIRHVKNPTTDESRFCHECYAELYLPKCRKCAKPIERGAVTDRVGKVLGKYHAECFTCFQCSAPFPTGDFYVWERKPVCAKHYHRLAGTTCCHESCGEGIEGPCVSLYLDGSSASSVVSDDSSHSGSICNSSRRKLYHPEHFICSRRGCPNSLHEFHFVLNGQPWCEKHAIQEDASAKVTGYQNPQPSRGGRHYNDRGNATGLPSAPRLPPQPQPARRMERRRTVIQNVRNR